MTGSSPDADCVYIDVDRDGKLALTQTTGRTLNVAVNGEWAVAPDRERVTVDWARNPEIIVPPWLGARAAEHDRLTTWLTEHMATAGQAGELPVDTAIRLLSAFQAVAGTAQTVVGQIVVPIVDMLRRHGLDPIPDGLTIPPTRATEERAAMTASTPPAPSVRLNDKVHYTAFGTPRGEYASVCRAADVTEVGGWIPEPGTDRVEARPGARRVQVWEPTAVSLLVKNPTGLFLQAVPRGFPAHAEGAPDCPARSTHGAPFKYCSCGWMETPSYEGGTWHPDSECETQA